MAIMTLESNEVVGEVEMQAAAGHLAVEYNAFAAVFLSSLHSSVEHTCVVEASLHTHALHDMRGQKQG